MQVYARFVDANANWTRTDDDGVEKEHNKKRSNDDRLLFMQYIAILLAILCTAMNILWIHLMKY